MEKWKDISGYEGLYQISTTGRVKHLAQTTIEEFKKGLEYLCKAYVYAQRIDWLLSGDDSEESFHKRLKKDLEEIQS